jgi:hypothetical protein
MAALSNNPRNTSILSKRAQKLFVLLCSSGKRPDSRNTGICNLLWGHYPSGTHGQNKTELSKEGILEFFLRFEEAQFRMIVLSFWRNSSF